MTRLRNDLYCVGPGGALNSTHSLQSSMMMIITASDVTCVLYCLVACGCDVLGSQGDDCDNSGKCVCKHGFTGDTCDRCDAEFYRYPLCIRTYCSAIAFLLSKLIRPTTILLTNQTLNDGVGSSSSFQYLDMSSCLIRLHKVSACRDRM